jgi:UDP-N-acetyl-D-glucosamine dehydrogenase
MSKVAVVGQGYVGLPLAIAAAGAGHLVVGYDTDVSRVKRLLAGDSFVEDVPDSSLLAALESGRYEVSADPACLEGFDVALIAVPTPLRDGVPDLSFIEQAAATVGSYLRAGGLVVLESTTYPGTTEELVAPTLEQHSGLAAGIDFLLGYSPERIDPGNRAFRLDNTPKIVSGIDEASLGAVSAFYAGFVDRLVPVSSTRVAELAKLVENTFRHVNVALANELKVFAGDLGVDLWEALDAASTKPFGFMRFDPGPGVGGHCLPIDPIYLSWRARTTMGTTFRFVELANDVNTSMPSYVVRRLVEALNRRRLALNGSRVLLLGLAYKRNSGDVRGSPALVVAAKLVALGASVRAVDPFVDEDPCPGVTRVELDEDELEAADAVVVLTDHDAFAYDLVLAKARYILDTRGRLRGARGPVELL